MYLFYSEIKLLPEKVLKNNSEPLLLLENALFTVSYTTDKHAVFLTWGIC